MTHNIILLCIPDTPSVLILYNIYVHWVQLGETALSGEDQKTFETPQPSYNIVYLHSVSEYTSDFTLKISFDPYNDPARQTILIVSILHQEETAS